MWAIGSIVLAIIGLITIFSALKMRESSIQNAGYVITFAGVVCVIVCCFAVISSGHVGVPVVFGSVDTVKQMGEGINVVNPFASVFSKSIQTENYTMSKVADQGEIEGDDSIEALSKEGMKMPLDVTVAFRLIGEDAGWVHQIFGENWRDVLVRSPARTSVREACAEFDALEAFAKERGAFATQIETKLIARIAKLVKDRCEEGKVRVAIQIVDVQLRQVGLPDDITDAIEDKLTKQQEDEAMVHVNSKEIKEKTRIKTEAEGIADYNREIEKSLTPNVLKYKAIEAMKLLSKSPNTKVYVIGGGDGGMPLIMNDTGK